MSFSQSEIDQLLAEAEGLEESASVGVSTESVTQTEPPPQPVSAATVSPAAGDQGDLRRLLHMSVPIVVSLAQREMPIESILAMTVGTIIEFDASFDSELGLEVSNHKIGQGQAVKVGENFGLRITTIADVPERIGALGSGTC